VFKVIGKEVLEPITLLFTRLSRLSCIFSLQALETKA
jgi:hypothetical protein